jgi:hypothetical protein
LKNENKIALRFTPCALSIEWISLGCRDITFNIHPECQNEIDDQWRSHGKKSNIDKPGSYTGSGDS